MKKRLIISAILLSGMSYMFPACKSKLPEEHKVAFFLSDTMMAHSETTPARLDDVKAELKLFGKVEADNNKLAQVYPVVGGNVIKINVELGDLVQQGQILASVRSAEVADFERQKLDAQSDVILADKNLQVARDLFTGKLNSERDVKSAEKELEKAKSELNRINEIFRIYSLSSGSVFNITSPISGFVVTKDINQNEQLRSDKSDVIFSIAQIDEVWVLANVNESDISRVKVGYEADVETISYPGKIFKGKVDRIFNAIDPSTKAMKVLIKLPNTELMLKPEMSATVTLKYYEPRKMIAIPSSSVIFDKSKHWTMIFKSRSNIETRPIEVYRQLGGLTYLVSGVNEGEKVISKNGLMIYDELND